MVNIKRQITDKSLCYDIWHCSVKNTLIRLRKIWGETVIEFAYHDGQSKTEKGLIYTMKPGKQSQIEIKVDENWYIYCFGMV